MTAALQCVNITSSFLTGLQTPLILTFPHGRGRERDRKGERTAETKTDKNSVHKLEGGNFHHKQTIWNFEILAGVVIEHGSLITLLPGWPAIMMTYHRAEEHGVYNKILQHDKHCPKETHSTLCRLPQTRPPRIGNGGFS